MAKLFGREVSKRELETKLGSMAQLCGITLVELADGPARGVRAALMRTGSGLDFTITLDRAMDISTASYKGVPLNWRSCVGDIHPAYYEPENLGWLRTFQGGLMQTCGLQHVGNPEEEFGLHDRISTIPARNVSVVQTWQGNRYVMSVEGEMVYGSLYFGNLLLKRKISTQLGAKSLVIEDTVTNEWKATMEHMIFYHVNIGFPILDNGSEWVTRSKALPRDAEAEIEGECYMKFHNPRHGYKEKCYFHEPQPSQGDNVINALVNKKLGLGIYQKYPKRHLPALMEWKMMGMKEYVVGMEPGNTPMRSRAWLRKNKRMPKLRAGQSVNYRLELGVLDGKAEIDGTVRLIKKR